MQEFILALIAAFVLLTMVLVGRFMESEERKAHGRRVVDDMLTKRPLVAFSMYSDIQSEIIRDLGKEIIVTLDGIFDGDKVDAVGFNKAYGQFWLWVIGSYEVVRTMCQSITCFEDSLAVELRVFKKEVSVLRMPFANQEYQGKKGKPVEGEVSVYGIDNTSKDFTFEVKGKIISVRQLVSSFETIFDNITLADIRSDHRQVLK